MSGIPEATAIILTTAERSELEGLVRSTKTEHRLRQRARIVLFAAEGMASRAIGRAVGARPGQPRSGACAMAKGGLTASTKRATEAPSQNTRQKRTNAFWRCWISQSQRVMPGGRDRCGPWRSATSMCSMSGGSCGPRRSISQGANPGARATIRSLPPRRPTWSGSTWLRRRTRCPLR